MIYANYKLASTNELYFFLSHANYILYDEETVSEGNSAQLKLFVFSFAFAGLFAVSEISLLNITDRFVINVQIFEQIMFIFSVILLQKVPNLIEKPLETFFEGKFGHVCTYNPEMYSKVIFYL